MARKAPIITAAVAMELYPDVTLHVGHNGKITSINAHTPHGYEFMKTRPAWAGLEVTRAVDMAEQQNLIVEYLCYGGIHS